MIVLSVTSALFNRVSYQSMRLAPWIQLHSGPSPRRTTLSLNYDSLLAPTAILTSLRNRHFLVTISTAISLALKAITVLLPGLLFIREVTVSSTNVSLPVHDTFLGEITPPQRTAELFENTGLIWTMRNLLNIDNASLPRGYTLRAAHQAFGSPSASDTEKSEAVVQGMWSDLECVPAEVVSVAFEPWVVFAEDYGNVTYTFRSPFCEEPIIIFQVGVYAESKWMELERYFGAGGESNVDGEVVLSGHVAFASSCQGAKEPVFMTGYMFRKAVNGSAGPGFELANSSVVTCKPSYVLGQVEVLSDGSATPLPGRNDRLLGGDMTWNIMVGLREGSRVPTKYDKSGFGILDELRRGNPEKEELRAGFKLLGQKVPRPQGLTAESMIKALKAFYRAYPPLLAHLQLRREEPSTVVGSRSQRLRRLLVEPTIAHTAAISLGILALLLILAVAFYVPKSSILPCNPEPIPGTLFLLNGSDEITRALAGTVDQNEGQFWTELNRTPSSPGLFRSDLGPQKEAQLAAAVADEESDARQDKKWCQPVVLRSLIRSLVSALLVVIIATLLFLLVLSERQNGIGPGSTSYTRFLWSVLPTLVMAGLNIYFASADHQTRVMAPFILLRREALSVEKLSSSLADQLAPVAFWSAIRGGFLPAVMSTSGSILAGFLTVFSATLFATVSVPTSTAIMVQQEEWFASFAAAPLDPTESLLGLVVNEPTPILYTPWTYEDLIFPAVSVVQPIIPPGILAANSNNNMTISMRVPALRPRLNCTRMPPQSLSYDVDPLDHPLGRYRSARLNVDDTRLPPSLWTNARCGDLFDRFTPPPTAGPIPFQLTSPPFNISSSCSTLNLIWGSLHPSSQNFTHLSAYACTDHVDSLLVDLTLSYPSFQILSHLPPIPIESTTVPLPDNTTWAPIDATSWISPSSDKLSPKLGLTPNLTMARYGIPNTWLTDPGHEEQVLAAQMDYLTRYLASLYSQTLRRTYNQSAVVDLSLEEIERERGSLVHRRPAVPETATRPGPVEGRVTDWAAQRVVQSRAATIVLVVLLVVLLGLNSVALVRGVGAGTMERDVLREDPGSIAAMARLAVGTGLFESLRLDETMVVDEKGFGGALEGKRLRLGFFCRGDDKVVYGIGVDDDEWEGDTDYT